MRTRHRLVGRGALVLLLGLGAANGTRAAPITFNSALPVAQGEFVFRQLVRSVESSGDSTPANRNLRATAAVSVLGYGLTEDLALFGMLPYVDKDFEITLGGSRLERRNRGLADVTGFARYDLWRDDAPGRTFRISGFGGLTAPTGNDAESDHFGRFPPPLQDGTGAWDWFGGLVATYQALGFELDGQLSYRNNREANDFEPGDEARLDLAGQYRLWPRQLGEGIPGFLYSVLELNYLHQEKNRRTGRRAADSGGDTIWLSPGVQYVTRRWVLEAVVQKPIYQQLNDGALENDLIVTAGFRMNF